MRTVVVFACVALEAAALAPPGADPSAIDRAAGHHRKSPMPAELVASFSSEMRSFGSVRTLPLETLTGVSPSGLEGLTGLPREAFLPRGDSAARSSAPHLPRQGRLGSRAEFEETSAVLETGLAAFVLLGAACLSLRSGGALAALQDSRNAWYPALSGVLSGSAVSLKFLEASRGLRSLRADRREAILRHEAGHFLACVLLGVPVVDVHVAGWQSLLGRDPGVTYVSPVKEALSRGKKSQPEDVDRLSVILMAGVAAEALHCGSAAGGSADLRALKGLLASQVEGADPLERGRWAAANAVLLLRAYPEAFEALCDALRERATVGECCAALEAAFAAAGGRSGSGMDGTAGAPQPSF